MSAPSIIRSKMSTTWTGSHQQYVIFIEGSIGLLLQVEEHCLWDEYDNMMFGNAPTKIKYDNEKRYPIRCSIVYEGNLLIRRFKDVDEIHRELEEVCE